MPYETDAQEEHAPPCAETGERQSWQRDEDGIEERRRARHAGGKEGRSISPASLAPPSPSSEEEEVGDRIASSSSEAARRSSSKRRRDPSSTTRPGARPPDPDRPPDDDFPWSGPRDEDDAAGPSHEASE